MSEEGESLVGGDEGVNASQTFTLDPEVFGAAGDDGRPEHVPEKFFDAENGQIKIGELLATHNHLDKKLGAFEGAPKDGYTMPEIQVPEGLEYSIADDDPLLVKAKEWANSVNLSDKAFGGLVSLFVSQQVADLQGQKESLEATRTEALAALGENGEAQLNALTQTVRNMIPSEWPAEKQEAHFNGYKEAVTGADSLRFIRDLIQMNRPQSLPNLEGEGGDALTQEVVDAEQNKPDPENPKKRLYDNPGPTGDAHRKKVREMRERLHGTGPALKEVKLG